MTEPPKLCWLAGHLMSQAEVWNQTEVKVGCHYGLFLTVPMVAEDTSDPFARWSCEWPCLVGKVVES